MDELQKLRQEADQAHAIRVAAYEAVMEGIDVIFANGGNVRDGGLGEAVYAWLHKRLDEAFSAEQAASSAFFEHRAA